MCLHAQPKTKLVNHGYHNHMCNNIKLVSYIEVDYGNFSIIAKHTY
jgi:hypothetical protein